jgi:hypothetical protein
MYPLRDLISKHGSENCEDWQKTDLRPVIFKDLVLAIKTIRSSVGEDEIIRYIKWNE